MKKSPPANLILQGASPCRIQPFTIITFVTAECKPFIAFAPKRLFRNGVLLQKSHGAETIKNTGCSFVQPARKIFVKPLRIARFCATTGYIEADKSCP